MVKILLIVILTMGLYYLCINGIVIHKDYLYINVNYKIYDIVKPIEKINPEYIQIDSD